MIIRRLFIFAAYDSKNNHNGIIDDSLLVYLRELSAMGDVVFYMDNDVKPDQLAKVAPYVIYAGANRHNEYDFGSYKRGYIWTCDNLNLADYDWVYLVNDSVYAPTHPLLPIIKDLESRGLSATGMVCNPNPRHPHIQSWFIGMSKKVFTSPWFDKFICSVRHHDEKGAVTKLYEQGFTAHLIQNKISWECKHTIKNRGIYNKIKKLYKLGFPFVKKMAFHRHNGALGRQVLYVLNRIPKDVRDAIIQNAEYLYGEKYVSKFLTRNPLKIAYRNSRYFLQKIINGGI